MVTLYANVNCPHCRKVIEAIHSNIGVDVNIRYLKNDPAYATIVQEGGKVQAPYLVDDATGTKMYESDDIIAYLTEHYGK